MSQCNKLNVKSSNSKLNKLKSGMKNFIIMLYKMLFLFFIFMIDKAY